MSDILEQPEASFAVLKETYPIEMLFREIVEKLGDELIELTIAKRILEQTGRYIKPERNGTLHDQISELTLGELIKVLEFDLSKIYSEKMYSFNDSIEDIPNYRDFQLFLHSEKTKYNTIWDLLKEQVIEKYRGKIVEIGFFIEQLGEIKELRDKAAHFKKITKEDLDNAKKYKQSIMEQVIIKQTPSVIQISEPFKQVLKEYRETMEKLDSQLGYDKNELLEKIPNLADGEIQSAIKKRQELTSQNGLDFEKTFESFAKVERFQNKGE
ncbi:MAG: hypothetical protein LBS41_03510 [Streptococcaceae bacterium]|jgi:hypothetical protein|nr:hypothetical protein [Streptococcaceae bacterium]